MSSSASGSYKSKELLKFYTKVRQGIKEHEKRLKSKSDATNCDDNIQQQVEEPKLITNPRSRKSKFKGQADRPGELFGSISRSEFEKILETYERQQLAEGQRENPVFCKKVDGDSFDKLLHSKVGFHHLASTDFLLEDLNINDLTRYTFLGGQVGSYDLFEGEDLRSLIKKHSKIYIRQYLHEAWHYLSCFDKTTGANSQIAKDRIDMACRLDPDNGDVLACLGRYYFLKEDITRATNLFERALKTKLDDPAKAKMSFADCYYELGLRAYNREKNQEALKLFENALELHPVYEGAKIHRNLCLTRINQGRSFQSNRQPAYRK